MTISAENFKGNYNTPDEVAQNFDSIVAGIRADRERQAEIDGQTEADLEVHVAEDRAFVPFGDGSLLVITRDGRMLTHHRTGEPAGIRPGLLADHTCGQYPDENGRITPCCSQCYVDAYEEGMDLGVKIAANKICEQLEDTIRGEFDILKIEDEKDVLPQYRAARRFLSMVKDTSKAVADEQFRKFCASMDQHLRRVMTEEELAAHLAEREERRKNG